MPKTILKHDEVAEAMIEYVRQHLLLEDKEGPEVNSQSAIFTGRQIDGHTKLALEVVIKMHRDRDGRLQAADKDFAAARIAERSAAHKRADRTYTAVLFPMSLDHRSAQVQFSSPYFRKAHLLDTAPIYLRRAYRRFSFPTTKQLSRVEWESVIPLMGNENAYYNPQKKDVRVQPFRRHEWHEVLPAAIQLDKGYFWDYAKDQWMPSDGDTSRKAEVFNGIQEGLHDKIRTFMRGGFTLDYFTLEPYCVAGARLRESSPQRELF